MPTVRAEDCHVEYNVAPKLQQLIVYCHVECFAEHLPLAAIVNCALLLACKTAQ